MLGEFPKADLTNQMADHLAGLMPGGKVVYGVSRFSEDRRLLKTLLIGTKKALSALGRGSRFVNRDFRNLDAGTLHKERLFAPQGAEMLVLPTADGSYCLAETLAAQDVEAFAARDYGKPARDMVVGMLPPKLALMLINLSAHNGLLPRTLWDPFCGTGTVLVEACRLGIAVFGSDRSAEMIEASRRNLSHFFPGDLSPLQAHDASQPAPKGFAAEAIVTEGHLGPLFSMPLSPFQLQRTRKELEPLYAAFFAAAARSSVRTLVMCLPFWKTAGSQNAFLEKPLADANSFWKNTLAVSDKSRRKSLLFRRPDQIVGREIFIFERRL